MFKISFIALVFLLGCNNSTSNIKTNTVDKNSTTLESGDKCTLKPEIGRCRGMFRHYYFDATSKTCKEFIYGGCGGVVPFKTLENCKRTCE